MAPAEEGAAAEDQPPAADDDEEHEAPKEDPYGDGPVEQDAYGVADEDPYGVDLQEDGDGYGEEAADGAPPPAEGEDAPAQEGEAAEGEPADAAEAELLARLLEASMGSAVGSPGEFQGLLPQLREEVAHAVEIGTTALSMVKADADMLSPDQ